MKRLLLFFLLPLALWGQLSPVCPPSGIAGSDIPCSVMLGGISPVGTQVTLQLPLSIGAPTITIGAAGVAAQKVATCNTVYTCLVYGMNQILIAPGELLRFVLHIPATVTGNIPVGLITPFEADGQANSIVVTVNPPVTVSISPATNRCDVNGDGQITQADVDTIAAEVLANPQTAPDLNGDGFKNIDDVQLVVNAVLGLGCAAR